MRFLLVVLLFVLGCDDSEDPISPVVSIECGEVDYYQYYLQLEFEIPPEYIFEESDLAAIDDIDTTYYFYRDTTLASPYVLEDAYNFYPEIQSSPHFENWFVLLSVYDQTIHSLLLEILLLLAHLTLKLKAWSLKLFLKPLVAFVLQTILQPIAIFFLLRLEIVHKFLQ